MSFEENIVSWVKLDNKIKEYNNQIKQLRSDKKELTENLLHIAVENNYDDAVIEITGGKLKFQQDKVQSPLTYRYIKQCLTDCINNEETVETLMKYIKSNRETKYVDVIKRTYLKN